MSKTLGELARIIEGELVGDERIVITGAKGIEEAGKGDIAFLANSRYFSFAEKTNAEALVVPLDFKDAPKPHLKAKDPSLAFTQIVAALYPVEPHHPQGVHAQAVVAAGAQLGDGVAIGPCAVIEDEAVIGDNTIVYAGCYIGHGVKIGKDCLFHANVSVRERSIIGNRVFIQSGAVIGSEGFGYTKKRGAYQLIPQVGIVGIEDDVEIGANVAIDRARFDKTVIGKGTKIDNLVQIAHNVDIGQNSIIVAQAGISGSTKIGKDVTIAGQAGLVGHITIGDGAILAAQAGVTKSVPAGQIVSGYPARPHKEAKKLDACLRQLPELIKAVGEIQKMIQERL